MARKLIGLVGLAMAIAVGCGEDAVREEARALTVAPASSGIEHVVVVMMENRSFDHMLGWLDGADGRQAGLRYPDRNGQLQKTQPLAPDFQGCGAPGSRSFLRGRARRIRRGRVRRMAARRQNDSYAIGYYRNRDLAFFGRAAPQWTAVDRYFAAIMSETFPNRIYQHAAQTDRLTNTFDISVLPTIWDRLARSGSRGVTTSATCRSWRCGAPSTCRSAVRSPRSSRTRWRATCPRSSFVDPRFVDEAERHLGRRPSAR